jgi:hypothetical protein
MVRFDRAQHFQCPIPIAAPIRHFRVILFIKRHVRLPAAPFGSPIRPTINRSPAAQRRHSTPNFFKTSTPSAAYAIASVSLPAPSEQFYTDARK